MLPVVGLNKGCTAAPAKVVTVERSICSKHYAKMHAAGVKEHYVPTLHHFHNLLVGNDSLKGPRLGSVLVLSDTLYPRGHNLSNKPALAASGIPAPAAATKSIVVGL